MIPVHLIVAGAVVVASFGAGWSVQGWRMDAQLSKLKTEYATAQAQAVEQAHAETIRLQAKKDEAEKTHAVRIADLRKSVAATSVIVNGLRNELATARAAMPSASCDSIRLHAATLNDVFGECAAEIERLAGTATGHAIDTLKLLESWPEYNPQLSKSGMASESR